MTRYYFFLIKTKTAYDMRISDWSSDVCSSDLENRIRAEGFPNYSVTPPGEREVYFPITLIEPFDERNQRAFGYDMFSEPVRREAMRRSEERRVGKECVSTCRLRWSLFH